jgi:gamma-D-glutamyl-L-lysine dipeptidyl-peptidase
MLDHILASILLFNYINIPVSDMREKPSQDAEIVSQALFAESVSILNEYENWVKIETSRDKYQGWVNKSALCQTQDEYLSISNTKIAKVNQLAAHLYHVEDTVYGPILTLPYGTFLEVVDLPENPQSRWIQVILPDGRLAYIQRGHVMLNPPGAISREEMCRLSQRFLGLPYTWGGRSSFGFDCSGFIQMLYREMGINLPRDSKDQFKWEGITKISEEALAPGDLIYWGYTVDKIRHVGLYLGEGNFIHATAQQNMPYLRISNLKEPFWSGFGLYPYREYRTTCH